MQVRTSAAIVALSLVLVLTACSDDEPVKLAPPASGSSPALTAGAGSATLPAGHPSTSGKTLAFTAQPGWVTEAPSNSMRKAQYKLPKQGGDAEDAALVVSFFGGEAGSVEANVERWASMLEQPGGGKSLDAGKRSTRTVSGMEVFQFDLSGTLVQEMVGPSSQSVHKENWRAINAIIKSDHGSYYVKFSGPAGTVAHWEPSFQKFLDAVKPAGG